MLPAEGAASPKAARRGTGTGRTATGGRLSFSGDAAAELLAWHAASPERSAGVLGGSSLLSTLPTLADTIRFQLRAFEGPRFPWRPLLLDTSNDAVRPHGRRCPAAIGGGRGEGARPHRERRLSPCAALAPAQVSALQANLSQAAATFAAQLRRTGAQNTAATTAALDKANAALAGLAKLFPRVRPTAARGCLRGAPSGALTLVSLLLA